MKASVDVLSATNHLEKYRLNIFTLDLLSFPYGKTRYIISFFYEMKLLKRHPLLSLFNSYLVDSPGGTPSNFYLWNYGLGLCLVILIITNLILAIKMCS